MWKLLKYDIKQSKRTMLIFLGIYMFLLIVGLLNGNNGEIFIYAVSMLTAFICFFQAISLYGNLFSSRCIHDHLIHYAGIKRSTIILEPIIFLLLMNVVSSISMAVLLFVFQRANVNMQFVHDSVSIGSETSLHTFPMYLMTMSSFWMFYGGFSLLVWSVLSLIRYKGSELARIIVLYAGIVILDFVMNNAVSRFYSNLLLLAISVICMILYYAISMRQNRKYTASQVLKES